jgi:hypothetical protein
VIQEMVPRENPKEMEPFFKFPNYNKAVTETVLTKVF